MKKEIILIVTFFVLSVNSVIVAQQWGLYTLYATKDNTKAYLIDTADVPVAFKTWTFPSTKKNGYSTYLIKGDTLVRTYTYSSNVLSGGGVTGGFQKVAWDGTVVWDVVYSTSTMCMHHDICPMPNGNVLLISYEVKSATEAQQAGATMYSTGIYSEKIVELKQTGPTTFQVVWEWHLWDHLCEEVNDSYNTNYVTDVLDHPELMDINYKTFTTQNSRDRFHMNGLDYNEERNQIAISMHIPNELYIIDHSTTSQEAAGHTGGNAGKGGDFLYRWGYPTNYDASGTAIFNTIHDAHWIAADHPTYPNYLCGYNNQGGTGGKTAIDIWNPPYNGLNFSHTAGTAYAPSTYAYRYTATWTATNEGNSQQLPNGNMLVNNAFGAIYEINSSGTVLWQKSAANSSHAYRFTKCYIRGHEVTVTPSASTICEGDELTINSTAVSVTETNPTYTYSWSSGQTTENISVSPVSNTTYTVTVTNSALGCTETASVSIIVNSNPAQPVISDNGGILSSTSAISYQWYLNGTVINGATNQNYTPVSDGDYQVEITDANGCISVSEIFGFVTGNEDISDNNKIGIYPNPASGIVHVRGIDIAEGMQILIYDACGITVAKAENTISADLSHLSNGLYYITIIKDEQILLRERICIIK